MASKCDNVMQLSLDSPDNFQLEFIKKLTPLDEALRCRICFEYFNNCMITKCSHNYCSVCIRRYMMYKAQCPICFQDASEPELRNNRLIDEVLRTYIKIKEMLKGSVSPQSFSSKQFEPEIVKKQLSNLDIGQQKSEKAESMHADEYEVSCPVCYKIVLKDRINIHLDSCLKIKQNEQERYSERKTLSKLVYHLLSDKDIRKRLKEHGLDASGDRQKLIRRHKSFITLYNANCDSLEPKPVTELVQEIERQELEERLNQFQKPIQVTKQSDASEIEKECKLYEKNNQSHFNALIQSLHQRQIGKIRIKQEVQEEETVGPESITGMPSSSSKTTSSESITHVEVKVTPEAKIDEINIIKNIKQEPPSFQIVEAKSLSKGDEKIEDLLTDESISSFGQCEPSKITQLNSLRKRKKVKKRLGQQDSPKKL